MTIISVEKKQQVTDKNINQGLRILARIIAREIVNSQLQAEVEKSFKGNGNSEYLRDK